MSLQNQKNEIYEFLSDIKKNVSCNVFGPNQVNKSGDNDINNLEQPATNIAKVLPEKSYHQEH